MLISSGETTYEASGLIDSLQRQRVNVFRPVFRRRRRGGKKDPLAQSFTVDETGAFLTAVDLFFANVDPAEKVTVQLRTVELGTPTEFLAANHAEVVLEPSPVSYTHLTLPTICSV